MSSTPGIEPARSAASARGGLRARWLWERAVDHYPGTNRRLLYLAIVVLATIVLYYQLYVPGAVSPSILPHYSMSFRFYVYGVGVVAAGLGAFASLIAGLADRWGRANMITYGLLLVALLILFGVPNAPDKWSFMVLIGAVGFVEGIVLVATPALIRDFSPQGQRALAIGFWTLGPVVGSLVVAQVSSHTLPHLHAWQDQFTIAGIVGLAVFLIALVGLRELSPGLRDQVMVSARDRALIEARARGIDPEAAMQRPWRQMLHLDIVGPSFGVAVLLLVYYALVAFLVIYFATIFHYSEQRANALANWYWAFNAGALIVVGVISDRLRVRKPFMVIGALGAIAMTILFLTKATQPHTGYYTFAAIMSALAVSLGVAYAPWFAAFTETVEKRNPALNAHGLAVSGWIGRIVVMLSALALPFVVSSMTPLVDLGGPVATQSARYAPELATAAAVDPATLHALTVNPHNAAAGAKAVAEISTKLNVSATEAIRRLDALATASTEPGFKFLSTYGPQVEAAAAQTPTQWQHWWWVCVGGEILFIPFIFLLVGRWSPARARRDAKEHERMLADQMSKLDGQDLKIASRAVGR